MSQELILTDKLEMLRALYDFKATYEKTIGFYLNDYFILHQTNTKHKNWWQVINGKGVMGYVPSNYVEKVKVTPEFLLEYVNKALDHMKNGNAPYEGSEEHKNEIVLRLKDIKRQCEHIPEAARNTISSEDNVPPLLYKNSDGKLTTIKSSTASSYSSNISEMRNLPEEPRPKLDTPPQSQALNDKESNIYTEIDAKKPEPNTNSTHSNISPIITHHSVYELVESVRINTQLSHEMSRIAVQTVVQGLHELLPASCFPYLSTILSHSQISLVVDDVQIDQTHDASRLKIIFNELTSCKEDSQQRSWMLHEDEIVIKEYITELISILSNADSSISRHVISTDHYHCITTLIQYYQMEVRWSIRQLLLQAFGVLCSLDKTVVNIMLNSILVAELARDMLANPRNIPKLNYSSLLLTMIFSMGEPMPITHLEILGKQFLLFVLDNIEYPPDTDVDEQIPDLFLSLVISYNLQFPDNCNDNPVLNALQERDVAKTFTEKILLLLNREEDPVRIFDHLPAPPHSLLKLFIDLFSRKNTADLFYTNDIKVLIDITVRNISDLSPGDLRRHQYLELCRRVMRHTNYDEHKHRCDEILKCFTRIFCEESDSSKEDQKLVREISNEFPNFFK